MNWPPDALVVLRPELGDLLKAILEPIAKKQPRQAFYRRTVYFIEKLTRENPTIQSIEDREKLAEDLDLALVELFLSEGHRRYVFTRLFNFLRQFIESYRAPSSLLPGESDKSDMERKWQEMMRQKKLEHDFPWLGNGGEEKTSVKAFQSLQENPTKQDVVPQLNLPTSMATISTPEFRASFTRKSDPQ